jgi:hypothetical protein
MRYYMLVSISNYIIFFEEVPKVIQEPLSFRRIKDSGSVQLLRFVALRLLSRQLPTRHFLRPLCLLDRYSVSA